VPGEIAAQMLAPSATKYQASKMLTYQALEMPKRRTGLTTARWVRLIALWYNAGLLARHIAG